MLYNKDIIIIIDTKVSWSWKVCCQQLISLCSVCRISLCTHNCSNGSLCDILKVALASTLNRVSTVRTCHLKFDITFVGQTCWHIAIKLLAIRRHKTASVASSIFVNIPKGKTCGIITKVLTRDNHWGSNTTTVGIKVTNDNWLWRVKWCTSRASHLFIRAGNPCERTHKNHPQIRFEKSLHRNGLVKLIMVFN